MCHLGEYVILPQIIDESDLTLGYIINKIW